MNKLRCYFLLFVFVFLGLSSCQIKYSASGTNIHPDAKTVSIQYFQNNAANVHPTLSQQLTEALRSRFISETKLNLVNGIGDLNFEGEIQSYETKPQDIQTDDVASKNRLTISVKVTFSNIYEPQNDFSSNFNRYKDYDSEKNLDEVADQLNKEIIELLVEDIFNKAVVNW